MNKKTDMMFDSYIIEWFNKKIGEINLNKKEINIVSQGSIK